MKSKLIILTLLKFLLFFSFCLFAGPCCIKTNHVANSPNKFGINSVNHKGYYTAPENTLSAFKLSTENGFNMVECDVRLTKDGIPVLLHDETVDRTSNGKGAISELTFEEARVLDFGSWKSDKYSGEKMPTFQEFIKLCSDLSVSPYIEIKAVRNKRDIKNLIDIVIQHDLEDKVSWISFNTKYLKWVLDYCNTARIGYVVNSISQDICNKAKMLASGNNNIFLDCKYTNLSDNDIELCKRDNLPLEVWTVNDEKDLLNLNSYISGVTSDFLHADKILSDKVTNE